MRELNEGPIGELGAEEPEPVELRTIRRATNTTEIECAGLPLA